MSLYDIRFFRVPTLSPGDVVIVQATSTVSNLRLEIASAIRDSSSTSMTASVSSVAVLFYQDTAASIARVYRASAPVPDLSTVVTVRAVQTSGCLCSWSLPIPTFSPGTIALNACSRICLGVKMIAFANLTTYSVANHWFIGEILTPEQCRMVVSSSQVFNLYAIASASVIPGSSIPSPQNTPAASGLTV